MDDKQLERFGRYEPAALWILAFLLVVNLPLVVWWSTRDATPAPRLLAHSAVVQPQATRTDAGGEPAAVIVPTEVEREPAPEVAPAY